MTSLVITAELGAEAETEEPAQAAVALPRRRLPRLRRAMLVAAGPWAIFVSAYLFFAFVQPRWAKAAHPAVGARLAYASLPLASIDVDKYNILTGLIIANAIFGLGQLGDLVFRWIERYRKLDEGSFRAKCMILEEQLKQIKADLENKVTNYESELARRQKEFNERLQQQLASGSLNTKDYEARIKRLQETVDWANEQNDRLRSEADRAHELLALQAKGATVEQKVEVHADKAQVSTTTTPEPAP